MPRYRSLRATQGRTQMAARARARGNPDVEMQDSDTLLGDYFTLVTSVKRDCTHRLRQKSVRFTVPLKLR